MKPFSILVVICLFSYLGLHAQSQSLADGVVAGQKGVISGLLGTELGLKGTQAGQLILLEELEERYNSKRGIKASVISGAAIFATLQVMISTLGNRISDVEYNIFLRKVATFGIRHGLAQIEDRLKREKQYFNRVQEQYGVVMLSVAASGGPGYTYTALLKLLLRVMKIRNEVLKINKEVKSLMGASWLLSR